VPKTEREGAAPLSCSTTILFAGKSRSGFAQPGAPCRISLVKVSGTRQRSAQILAELFEEATAPLFGVEPQAIPFDRVLCRSETEDNPILKWDSEHLPSATFPLALALLALWHDALSGETSLCSRTARWIATGKIPRRPKGPAVQIQGVEHLLPKLLGAAAEGETISTLALVPLQNFRQIDDGTYIIEGESAGWNPRFKAVTASGKPLCLKVAAGERVLDPQDSLYDTLLPVRPYRSAAATWLAKMELYPVKTFEEACELVFEKPLSDIHKQIREGYARGGGQRRTGLLSCAFSVRIENFCTEYLGTAEHPVPFGGRNAELAVLTNWLDDPGSTPYLLMVAPAGRGKSTLLARWTRSLSDRNNLTVIFFPISVRFNTNLSSVVFGHLAAQLAHLHGDTAPDPNTPAEVLRGMTSVYLGREPPGQRQLLLVLDGLDEAADWQGSPDLFPLTPTPRLRVVVSARSLAGESATEGWAGRLGWHNPSLATAMEELAPLSRDAVAEVLRNSIPMLNSFPAYAKVIDELHRLSEGDPLVLRLYVEGILAKRGDLNTLTHEELQELRPGLAAYIERWLDDQRSLWGDQPPLRRLSLQTVLSILSCALGPLSREDLLSLAPEEVGMTAWTLDEDMRFLRRLVVGDGRRQGYMFSHQRLTAYFHDRLALAGEAEQWERRFLEWGRTSLRKIEKGDMAPANAPRYVVQYYGAHLERVRSSPDEMAVLATSAWQRAWEEVEGSYVGFVNDVRRLWRAAENADREAVASGITPPFLGREIRCAIIQASVISLVSNIHPELFAALLDAEVWSLAQGIARARQNPYPYGRCLMLAAVAEHLSGADRDALLSQALEAALNIDHEQLRSELLITLLRRFPEPLSPRILASVSSFKDNCWRDGLLRALVSHVPDALLNDVLARIWPTSDEELIAAALARLDDRGRQRMMQGVLQQVQENWDDPGRARFLQCVSPHLPKALCLKALEVARSIKDTKNRIAALAAMAPHLREPAKDSMLREALDEVRAIVAPDCRARCFASLLAVLPSAQCPAVCREALEAIWSIEEESCRGFALREVAPHIPHAEMTATVSAVMSFGDPWWKYGTLASLLPYLSEHMKHAVLDEAFAALRQAKPGLECHYALQAIIPYLPDSLLDEAASLAGGLSTTYLAMQILTELALRSKEPMRTKLLREAAEIGLLLLDEEQRFGLLALTVVSLPEALSGEVLASAYKIGNPHRRAKAFTALATHAHEIFGEGVLREALEAARASQNAGQIEETLDTLAAVVPQLSPPLRDQSVYAALAMARQGLHDREHYEHYLVRDARESMGALQSDEDLYMALMTACKVSTRKYLRSYHLAAIAGDLGRLPAPLRLKACQYALRALASSDRDVLLSDLQALWPLIAAIGGQSAAVDTARALLDVGEWWP